MTILHASDKNLFPANDLYDSLPIQPGECWRTLELDSTFKIAAALPLPNGFGVCFREGTSPKFRKSVRIPSQQASAVTLREACRSALNDFTLLRSAADVLAIDRNEVFCTDVAGTVRMAGSWTLPLAVNRLALADAKLPFHAEASVNPNLTVSLSGEIALTSEFSVRCRRLDGTRLRFSLCRKHDAALTASFSAGAGVGVYSGKTDLLTAVLAGVDPGIKPGDLEAGDAAKFRQVLSDCVDHSLTISLNAVCSAAAGDEAGFVYDVDVSAPDNATHQAIEAALHGNWSALSKLPNTRKVRDVLVETLDKSFALSVNLLGLYNYRSVTEFLKKMEVRRNLDDGSIVLTDSTTASEISTAATPFGADGDRLRAVLYRSFLVTATYKALFAAVGTDLNVSARQDYLIYKESMGYRDALKQLKAGQVLGAMQPHGAAHLPSDGPNLKHCRIAGSCDYSNDDVLRFFFSDITKFTPRTAADLKRVGRQVLAQLLDDKDITDHKRIQALVQDSLWAQMDRQPAQIQEPFLADWLDITEWAEALAQAAPVLAATVAYAKTLSGDPTNDAQFQAKRTALASAFDRLSRNTRSAFEISFPLCVMAMLAGATSGPNRKAIFEARWNGKLITSNKTVTAPELTAVV